MRFPTAFRNLWREESSEARKVFELTLGPHEDIYLSDGLGSGDAPFTIPSTISVPLFPAMTLPGKYVMFVGDRFNERMNTGYSAAVLIHELTHVWQYRHGYNVIYNSLSHRMRSGEDMYSYDKVHYKAWASYNVEQQAQIIEDWYYLANMKEWDEDTATGDPRFLYVKWNIRAEKHNTGEPILIPLYKFDSTRPDLPFRVTQGQMTDPLAEMMAPRYKAGDPASLERVRMLELLFRKNFRPKQLLARLEAKRPDDKGVRDFYHVLDPATITRLLGILRSRAA
jgi:hypothetical protein